MRWDRPIKGTAGDMDDRKERGLFFLYVQIGLEFIHYHPMGNSDYL
jgi:hypothetical protein